jgi:hypothetical protein
MDMLAICNALAARYAPGTIGTPATGTPATIRAVYGQAPHSMPTTPAVVVMPQTGDVVMGSGTWDVTHHIDVLFYHSKKQGDVPRSETQRQLWLPSLLEATLGAATLGLGGVVKSALPVEYEFLELPYGGDSYEGIRIGVDVIVREPVTLTP